MPFIELLPSTTIIMFKIILLFLCLIFYRKLIKLWKTINYMILFRILYNEIILLFFFCEKMIFRECIIRNDMLWYAFISGKCISFKHILNYRFACSSIIRVVSIASSLQLFAPMYVYNDGGMRYAEKKRMSIERQELLHSHISLVSNISYIYDGYSDEIS